MVNLLTLVEVANNNNVMGPQVVWPVERSFKADTLNLNSLKSHLKDMQLVFTETGDTVTVKIHNREELNRFAGFYFPILFKAQLMKAETKDKAIKRTFREIIGKIYPSPNTVIAEDAILKVSVRLENCGISLAKS